MITVILGDGRAKVRRASVPIAPEPAPAPPPAPPVQAIKPARKPKVKP